MKEDIYSARWYEHFGVMVRHKMLDRGLSFSSLAAEAGMTPQTVSRACKGNPVASETVKAIYEALERIPSIMPLFEIEYLTPGIPPVTPPPLLPILKEAKEDAP